MISRRSSCLVVSVQVRFFVALFTAVLFCRTGTAEQVVISPDGITAPMFHNSQATCYGTEADTHINLGFPYDYWGSETGHFNSDRSYCTISGGQGNRAIGDYATVGGGWVNTAEGFYAFVGGGESNSAKGKDATIGGGYDNSASEIHTTVAGGAYNAASGFVATVGGGTNNTASGERSTVSGGIGSTASGYSATVAGGFGNDAVTYYTTVSGGSNNEASGRAAVVGGGSGNTASGDYAVIAGGVNNTAGGEYSAAGGRYMKLDASADRTFVWGHATQAETISTADSFLIFPAGTAGRVGIGTKTPLQELHVRTTSGNTDMRLESASGAWDIAAVSDTASSLRFAAYNTSGGYLGDRVSITQAGSVGIGTNSPNYKLDVRGTIGNNTTLYHSDQRWKKAIQTLDGALDKVSRLRGVSFQWRADEFREMQFPDGDHLGFIAQEVEIVVPEVVRTDEQGYKSVEYANLVPLLIEAVKEQQVVIARQEAAIARLDSDLKALKARLAGD